MTADTEIMRDAASDVASEEKRYSTAIERIDNLITSTLGQCWVDEAYDELKTKYTSKSRPDLRELGRLLQEFSKSLTEAADDLDKRINALR